MGGWDGSLILSQKFFVFSKNLSLVLNCVKNIYHIDLIVIFVS